MPDARSVMKEFRFLDQKRLVEGLSAEEAARYEALRDLVGPEAAPADARPGFDVGLAAARLRESLMPAGLRSRLPPEPSPESVSEMEMPSLDAAEAFEAPPPGALESRPAEASFFEPISPDAESQPPFDPDAARWDPNAGAIDSYSTGQAANEGQVDAHSHTWEPRSAAYESYSAPEDPSSSGLGPNAPANDANAPAFDPGAAAYDPNAPAIDPGAAAYDPNAPAFDPGAAAYDPNAPAIDPGAAAYDPNAPASDPVAGAYDPNAPAIDPSAAAYDPSAPAFDPGAAAYDPNAPGFDPGAAAYDPNAPGFDPNPAGYDPNAPEWNADATAYDPNAVGYDPNAPAWGPNEATYGPGTDAWDPRATAYPAEATPGLELESVPLTDTESAPSFEISNVGPQGVAASPEDDWSRVGEDAEGVTDLKPGFGPESSALDNNISWSPGDTSLDPSVVPAPLATEGPEQAWVPTPGGEYDAAAWDTGIASGSYVENPTEFSEAGGLDNSSERGTATDDGLIPYPPQGWSGEPEAAPLPVTQELGDYDESPPAMVDALDGPALSNSSPEDDLSPEMLPIESSSANLDPLGPGEVPAGEDFLAARSLIEAEAPGWQAEPQAVEQGFRLESGGSFAARLDAAAPEWAALPQPPAAWDREPEDGEELPPSDPYPTSPHLDAAAPDHLDFSSPDLSRPADDSGESSTLVMPATEFPPPPELAPLDVASLDLDMEPEPVPSMPEPEELSNRLQDADVTFLPGAVEPLSDELPTLDDADLIEELPPEQGGFVSTPSDQDEFAAAPVPSPAPGTATAKNVNFAQDVVALVSLEPPGMVADPLEAPKSEALADPEPARHVEYSVSSADPQDAPVESSPPTYQTSDRIEDAPRALATSAPDPLVPDSHERPAVEAADADASPPPEVIEILEPEPEAQERSPSSPEDHVVHGLHRVVVHTLEGQVKRGFLKDADLGAALLQLLPAQGATSEEVAAEHIKAIFFMLAPGEQLPQLQGQKVRVVFRDGRQVAGFSPDYREGSFGFFMIPADTRTSTGRIWVYQTAVRQVAVT